MSDKRKKASYVNIKDILIKLRYILKLKDIEVIKLSIESLIDEINETLNSYKK